MKDVLLSDALANEVHLTGPQVRARYGGISDMTLWRWLHDAELGFPAPIIINRRRLWPLSLLQEFERRQAGKRGEARSA